MTLRKSFFGILGALVMAPGCGGETIVPAESPAGVDKKDEPPQLLIRTDDEPPGANCPTGGTLLSVGLDDNFNDILDDNEIEDRRYVCNGLNTLSTTTRFAEDQRCPAGGVILRSGLDDDADGVLDPEEVDEETVVCDGADGEDGTCGPTATFLGDITIENSADVLIIRDCRVIDGDVTVAMDGRDIQLPALQELTGSLLLSIDRTRLTIPRLASIGGNVTVGDLSTLQLPMLATVSGALTSGTWGAVLVPELTSIGGAASVGRGSLFRGGKLGSIAGAVLAQTSARMELGALEQIGGNFTLQGETSISMPALEQVQGTIVLGASVVNLPSLQSVLAIYIAHHSSLTASLSAPQLTSVGSLDLQPGPGGAVLEIPNVATVERLQTMRWPTTLTAPSLQRVGSVRIIPMSGDSTRLPPSVVEVIGDFHMEMTQASGMGAVSLPALAQVGGDFYVHGAAGLTALSAPVLREIGGLMRLEDMGGALTELNVEALERVGEMRIGGMRALDLSLPALHTVTAHLRLQSGPRSLYAPVLAEIGGTLEIENAGMTSVDLPLLARVGVDLELRSNAQLNSISLPQLSTLGRNVYVVDNSALGTCQVLSLQARLAAAGYNGRFEQSGNRAEVCEGFGERCFGDREVRDGDYSAVQSCTEILGSLTVVSATPEEQVSLPNLRSVSNALSVSGSKRRIDFPNLESVGTTLSLLDSTEEIPIFGRLTQVGETLVAGTISTNFPVLASVPRLEVPAGLEHHRRLELDRLHTLTSMELRSRTTIIAPLLEQAHDIRVLDASASLHLSSLVRLTGDLEFYQAPGTGVGGSSGCSCEVLSAVEGSVRVKNSGVRGIRRAQLARIGGDLLVEDNINLESARFHSLTQVGGNVTFRNNPLLQTCGLEAMHARLLSHGFTGSYVEIANAGGCAEPTCTIDGDVFIRSISDVIAIRNCDMITGNLHIEAEASWGVTLDKLTNVGGSLTIAGKPQWYSFDYLRYVGGDLSVPAVESISYRQTGSISYVGGDFTVTGSGRLYPSNIDVVGGDLHVPDDTKFEARDLRIVHGSVTTGYRTRVRTEKLDVVGGSLSIGDAATFSTEQLSTVGGDLTIGRHVDEQFSMLSQVPGRMVVWTTASPSLPLLSEIGGDLIIYSETQMDAPLLATVRGQMRIAASSVDFPSLTSVGSSGIQVAHGWATAVNLSVPALETLERLTLTGRVHVNAPALTQVGVLSAATPTLTLSLAALEQATAVAIEGANDSATLSLGALSSVGSYLRIRNNAALTALGLSSLQQVGGEVRITGNSQLSSCEVNALISQLQGAGNPGPFDGSGNAPCP